MDCYPQHNSTSKLLYRKETFNLFYSSLTAVTFISQRLEVSMGVSEYWAWIKYSEHLFPAGSHGHVYSHVLFNKILSAMRPQGFNISVTHVRSLCIFGAKRNFWSGQELRFLKMAVTWTSDCAELMFEFILLATHSMSMYSGWSMFVTPSRGIMLQVALSLSVMLTQWLESSLVTTRHLSESGVASHY